MPISWLAGLEPFDRLCVMAVVGALALVVVLQQLQRLVRVWRSTAVRDDDVARAARLAANGGQQLQDKHELYAIMSRVAPSFHWHIIDWDQCNAETAWGWFEARRSHGLISVRFEPFNEGIGKALDLLKYGGVNPQSVVLRRLDASVSFTVDAAGMDGADD